MRRWCNRCGVGVFVAALLLIGNTAFAELFKGKTFQIDVPATYRMTVYDSEKSEMAFSAVHRDGSAINVVVLKNPFLGKEPDLDGEKRLEIGSLLTQTLQTRIWDHYGRPVIRFYDGDMRLNEHQTIYDYRWSYKAMEPREEFLEIITRQHIEGDYLYTITVATWRPNFLRREREFNRVLDSFVLVNTPEDEITKPTRLPTRGEATE